MRAGMFGFQSVSPELARRMTQKKPAWAGKFQSAADEEARKRLAAMPEITSGKMQDPAGLKMPGNINLNNRPRVRNDDGTISTLRSMSIGTDQGEVLIPTIADDGRRMTDEEAIAQYDRTGLHLGIFETPENATAFAKRLSDGQDRMLPQQKGGMFGTSAVAKKLSSLTSADAPMTRKDMLSAFPGLEALDNSPSPYGTPGNPFVSNEPLSAAPATLSQGAFGRGPVPGSYAARNNMQDAQPNFIENIMGYDPNEVDVSSFEYAFMSPRTRQAARDRVDVQEARSRLTSLMAAERIPEADQYSIMMSEDPFKAIQTYKDNKRLMDQAESLRRRGFTEEQVIAFLNNPVEFSKSLGSNIEAANLPEGTTRYLGIPGSDPFTAPTVGIDGGVPYRLSAGTDGKLQAQFGDPRPPSYADVTARMNANKPPSSGSSRSRPLTPEERSAYPNLDPSADYQIDSDGKVTKVSGTGNADVPSSIINAVDKQLEALSANSARLGDLLSKYTRFNVLGTDWNSQGEGWWNDLGQALSMETSALKAITAEMVGKMRTPGEGVMTDADAKRFEAATVSINNTKESNQLAERVIAAAARRAEQQEMFMRQWVSENGYRSYNDGKLAWLQYSRAYPVYDPVTSEPLEGAPDAYEWVLSGAKAADTEAALPPQQAIEMLKADPSPEAIAEFDELFGAGSARRVLNGSR